MTRKRKRELIKPLPLTKAYIPENKKSCMQKVKEK